MSDDDEVFELDADLDLAHQKIRKLKGELSSARAEADRLRRAWFAMVESFESLQKELESREGQMKQRRDERKRSMDPDEAESADMYNAGIRYAVEELQPAVVDAERAEADRLLEAAKFFHAIARQYGHGPQRLDSEYAAIWQGHFDAISDAVESAAEAARITHG